MGYTTEFNGVFKLNKKLTKAQFDYLLAFSKTRHMKRNVALTIRQKDLIRDKVKLPMGTEGEFYVAGGNDYPFLDDIIDVNNPPSTQPGLWCEWEPTDDRQGIQWNGIEKFYNYVEWLQYIITNFLKPWQLELNGVVWWQGEDNSDKGTIRVIANDVRVSTGELIG